MKIIKTLGFENEAFHFEDIQSFLTNNGNFVVFNSSPNIISSKEVHWVYIYTENEPRNLSFEVIPYEEADSLDKLNDWLQTGFEDGLCEAYERVPTINCADE